MRGYSQIVIEANQNAIVLHDGDETEVPLALRLGEMCIAKRYPAAAVAEKLNLSRQTVYDWFSGKATPQVSKNDKIKDLIEELSRLI
tara:strand:- start:764 stop:1024 length:261 start_codon:yes stop_codon:yes gene_type:complete